MIVGSFGRYTVEATHDHGNGRRWPRRAWSKGRVWRCGGVLCAGAAVGFMIVSGLGQIAPITAHDHDAPCLAPGLAPHRPGAHPGIPPRDPAQGAPARCHPKELGTKNSVSDTETDILTVVRLVPRCGNVAGTMRHVVLIACRSGA